MVSVDVDQGAGDGEAADGPGPRPGGPVAHLLKLLDLEEVGPDRYVGQTPAPAVGPPRLFGGQVASQALRAAMRTVRPDHHVHSLRAYFLRPGRHGPPLTLTVDRLRDGSSFTTRRVVAFQGDDAILNLDAQFHRDEPGDEHHPPSPIGEVAPPEDAGPPPVPPWAASLLKQGEGDGTGDGDGDGAESRVAAEQRAAVASFLKDRPVEMRQAGTTGIGGRAMWVRVPEPVGDDPALHAALLTYLSDMGPVGVVAGALGRPPGALMMASLDHCLWFHHRARADEWLLYALEPVAAGHGRGLARGSVWTRDGVLAATVLQEVLARRRNDSGTA
ncbi:MAG TPA: acyl-CoA thioesterase domain-containing protein [Acidimicrobiales bacterium]